MPFKFKVNRLQLYNWLNTAYKSFSFDNVMHDSYRSVKVKVSNSTLSFEVNDSISYLEVRSIPVHCDTTNEEISFVILISDIVKILGASKKEEVTLTWDAPILVVKTEGRYKLSTSDPDLFVGSLTFAGIEQAKEIDRSFAVPMKTLSAYASKDMIRPELSGVFVADDYYVATTGPCMAIHPNIDRVIDSLVFPVYAISFLNALSFIDEKLAYYRTSSDVVFISDTFTYSCRLSEGTFPKGAVDKLLDKKNDFKFKVCISGLAFNDALKRVLLFDADFHSLVAFKFDEKKVTISFSNEKRGLVSSEEVYYGNIDIPNGGKMEELTVHQTITVVNSFRKLFTLDDDIVLTVGGEMGPIYMKQKNKNYLFISMGSRLY